MGIGNWQGPQGASGSVIKSIQRGVLDKKANEGLVFDVTLPVEVDLSKAAIIAEPGYSVGGIDTATATVELLNSSTVRITRAVQDGRISVRWTVVEFENVNSIQSGKLSAGQYQSGEFYADISEVDLSKALLFSTKIVETSSYEFDDWSSQTIDFNSSTQLIGTVRMSNLESVTWCYYVVEFK